LNLHLDEVSTTSATLTVTDYEANPLKDVTVKVSTGGETVTDANGKAVITVKSGDQPELTLSKEGFVSIYASGNSSSFRLPRSGAILKGIATFTEDKVGTVPAAGAELKIDLGNNYVTRFATAIVGSDGAYQFSLPEGASNLSLAEGTFNGKKYTGSFTSYGVQVGKVGDPATIANIVLVDATPQPEAEPFAITSLPGKVDSSAASITITFNRDVDTVYANPTFTLGQFGPALDRKWSNGTKTLTLSLPETHTTGWGYKSTDAFEQHAYVYANGDSYSITLRSKEAKAGDPTREVSLPSPISLYINK
jgi:hypothetical protein